MKPREFLSHVDDQKVVAAIANAESKTSGEIRVYVSVKNIDAPVAAAQAQFLRLGMEKTRARNGVLVFFAPRSQTFAVIGDAGIHQKCGQAFWEEITAAMTEYLTKACFTEAIVAAVEKVGDVLARHFPRESDDRNELSNEVTGD
jgi:uncharacterized membrane protein